MSPKRRIPIVGALRGYLLLPSVVFVSSFLFLLFGVNRIPITELIDPPATEATIAAAITMATVPEERIVAPARYCGLPWRHYVTKIDPTAFTQARPLVWTVSGGDAYRSHIKDVLDKWRSVELAPVLVVSLDKNGETARHVCNLSGSGGGYAATVWDEPKASYSLVADAKFGFASKLASLGIPALFLEPDVFCRASPLPLLRQHLQPQHQLLYLGHGDVNCNPNIGLYYVRPTPTMAKFFDSLNRVLRYSDNQDKRSYTNTNNKTKDFFDQDVFYHCLPPNNPRDLYYGSDTNRRMYELTDTQHGFDLLTHCRGDPNHNTWFQHDYLSHAYINSHNPPTVLDTTLCIHPLFDTPFASFLHKLATAKFMGFDPQPVDPVNDRLLKTTSGDITFNECWLHVFKRETFYTGRQFRRDHFQLLMARLVWMALRTQRTLVIPRYMRDKDSWAIPILSLVDIQSIDRLVSWRFLSVEERLKLPPPQTVLVQKSMEKAIQAMEGSTTTVVQLEEACSLLDDTTQNKEVEKIRSQLVFCLQDPRVTFTRSIGGWSRLCGT